MKGPYKDNKKFKLNKDTDIYNVDAASLNNLYDWGQTETPNWGVNSKYTKEYWDTELPMKGSIYNAMDPYQEEYEWGEAERQILFQKWTGKLVRLIPVPDYGYNSYNTWIRGPASSDTSRTMWETSHPAGIGTVISLSDKANYKGQWHASVLWPDGLISYENISDLILVGDSGP